MTFWMQNGDAYMPTPGRDSMLDALPSGNYTVAQSMSGMFLQRTPAFEAPGKVYGNLTKRAGRILNTFLERPRATGALFAGEKGSGKSMLARMISYNAYDLGVSTILVNAPWRGDGFNSLLASIEQPAIVLMDEFEKVYDRDAQEEVLTLLDGTMTSKKLFILTVNDKYRVDSHMRNRPGRLFYAIDFVGLETEFVREYCEDILINQAHTEAVVKIGSIFPAFNFDMLKALVEEMNRYDEDPYEALELLNANPVPESYDASYDIQVWDREGTSLRTNTSIEDETPLSTQRGNGQVYIYVYVSPKNVRKSGSTPLADWERDLMSSSDSSDDDDEDRMINVFFKARDLTALDADKGTYEFVNEDGFKILYTKKKQATYDLRAL